MSPFFIRSASWQAERAGLASMRRQVLIIEQKIPESKERDDADENRSHVPAFSEKCDAVGTGRLEPSGRIARRAVLSECRREGEASAMPIRLVEEAQQKDFGQVYLHALNFNKKLGLSVTKKSILKVAYRMSWHA